ncbi:hypothetical protein EV195_10945 [Tenacibaculum skagerrakense]|uniref:Fimbrial assembly protein PilN n=1 Tax=Tenacibaculum skagerrakense TaxID=186571 RepID=A0A4R2NPG9_9FLAO|nr:hypothetical protein [Tenacibaculum skagerrakense]TCP23321.1 hypothetical protein EV195_10945 [Tenacibaculum skagerrakense]
MKDRLFFGNTFCAVEHSFDSDGNEEFHCLQLFKQKNELVLKNSESFNSLENLFSYLKEIKQEHLVLVVNNNQVLSKSIPFVEPNKELVFKNAYPTLVKSNFYAQVSYSNTDSFISIVRNDYVEKLVKEYQSKAIDVLDVVLGSLSVTNISDVIEETEVYTSNAEVTLLDEQIHLIKNKSFNDATYTINGLKIQSSYVLSLGAIVSFYLQKAIFFSENNVTQFKEKKTFNLGYKLVLGVIFLMVLVNFLFFSSYNKEVAKLREQLEIKTGAKLRLKEISVSLEKKRKLLSELQNSSLFSVSKYADQIVEEIPNSVVLSEINYQPIEGTIRKEKEVKFKVKEIEIKGVLNNYNEFTSWIDKIEQKKWVNQLLELSTEKDKRKKNSSFHVLIRVK